LGEINDINKKKSSMMKFISN